MKNFKEEFVNYQNDLIQNNQQRIELLFELNEFFLTTKLTFGQKQTWFLKLRVFHKELLDEQKFF